MAHKKEVIKKMKEEHPRLDVDFVERVLSTFEEIDLKKKQVTITQVATSLNLKREKIAGVFDWLVEYELIKKVGTPFAVPYLKVMDETGNAVSFIYGKENREAYIEKMLQRGKKFLEEKEYQEFRKILLESISKFLTKFWNPFVEKIWKTKSKNDLLKMEVGSRAIRYQSW